MIKQYVTIGSGEALLSENLVFSAVLKKFVLSRSVLQENAPSAFSSLVVHEDVPIVEGEEVDAGTVRRLEEIAWMSRGALFHVESDTPRGWSVFAAAYKLVAEPERSAHEIGEEIKRVFGTYAKTGGVAEINKDMAAVQRHAQARGRPDRHASFHQNRYVQSREALPYRETPPLRRGTPPPYYSSHRNPPPPHHNPYPPYEDSYNQRYPGRGTASRGYGRSFDSQYTPAQNGLQPEGRERAPGDRADFGRYPPAAPTSSSRYAADDSGSYSSGGYGQSRHPGRRYPD